MRFLLIEKKVEIRKDFQKLLDNAIRIYGTSKEEIIFKSPMKQFSKSRRKFVDLKRG